MRRNESSHIFPHIMIYKVEDGQACFHRRKQATDKAASLYPNRTSGLHSTSMPVSRLYQLDSSHLSRNASSNAFLEMPPQSRGPSPEPEQTAFSQSKSLPPTLRPYLENLPSPSILIPDQRTPTGPRMIIPDRDVTTPTPLSRGLRSWPAPTFDFGEDDKNGTEDEDTHESAEEDDVAGVTLDDDDFVSHYSRQESPESEDGGSGGSEDEEEAEEEADEDGDMGSSHQSGSAAGGYFPSLPKRLDVLSRVRSLPAQPPLQTKPSTQYQNGGLHISQSTTSLRPPLPPPLYPPFYNRPPTPLPPSPSLTSLLRPPSLLNRSATSTRPTTPDSSDIETPNDTEAAVAHSARRAHPLPPTSPKVPTYEYYGFVLYLGSTIAFLMYLTWSYFPSPFLHALGITYYPNRWWSLAIPAWIVVLLVFIYVALLSYNVEYLTLPLDSLECMVDEAGSVAITDEYGRVRKGGSKRFVKELEERARMEREMQIFKSKGRKYSKGGSGDKGKRRASRAETDHLGMIPPTIPARDYQFSPSIARSLSYNHASAHFSTNPYFADGDANSQPYTRTNSLGPYGGTDPNWKLVWNEGTDAVMDVPIGGVCEVLYG